MPSALFQIDPGTAVYGAIGVAQDAAGGVVVNCRMVSTSGVNPGLLTWTIFGTDGRPAPAMVLSGAPTGEIMSFTTDAEAGQAYGIQLEVNGGVEITGDSGTTVKSALFVLDDSFQRPFFVGETFESDPTYGIIPRLNFIQSAIALDYKESVTAASAAALPANTRTDNTLTASANGALTVDGIVVAVGNRILVKDEAAGQNNGIFVADDIGSAGTPWILTRAKGSDESYELQTGATTYAEEGASNAEKVYRLITPPPITINTTPLVFAVSMASGASGPAAGDLSGTYPNPEVAALHETSGPTKLTVGAIADTEFLVRSGATIVSQAGGGPPSGGAGGDLGGTYPNPSVAAVTETSGPTSLVAGAIADGEFLKRVGATLVGASAGGAIPTGNILYVDAVNGNNGTAVSGRLDLPYLTIVAALSAAVPGDAVHVYPGTYPEDVNVTTGISLIGIGGPERVLITGSGVGSDVVILDDGCYVHSIGVTVPIGFAGFAYGGAGLCYLYNAMVTGSDLTSVGFHHSGTGKVIITEFRYVGGDFDVLVKCTNTGILALTGMHVPGGGLINQAINASGGARLQLNDVNSGSPTVGDAVFCADATVIMRSSALFNCVNGLHITDNAANVQWTSVRFDSTSGFDILVAPGLTGANSTVNLTACELQEQKLSIPVTWLASDHNWTFQDAKSPIDEASFRAFTDLTVGHREKGFATDMGQGCPSARGQIVITSDGTASAVSDGGNLTDESVAAGSKSGSTFTYQGITTNHTILFGSDLRDAADSLKAWGAQFEVAFVRLGGALVAEIWDGAAWVEVGAAQTLALAPHTAAGPALFLTNDLVQVRIGVDADTTWAKKTILGFNLYWFRLRVSVAMTRPPIFEQSKLHPSCTRVGTDGVSEFFGNARQLLDQGITLRDTDDLNGISPGNADIEFGSLGGFTIVADILDNNFQNASVDGNSLVWPLSPNLDTSLPATLRIWWIPATSGSGDVEWEYGYRSIGVGSLLTAGSALDFSATLIATVAAGTQDELRFTDLPIDLSGSTASGGLLSLAWQRDGTAVGDTYAGSVQLAGIQLLAHQWRI